MATFAGCDISGTAAAGTYTLKATSGAVTSANSSSVSITAGTASTLTFSTQPSGTIGEGANFTTQPSVTAKDANGNTVSGASVTLSVSTYAAGTSGGNTQGTLGCNNNTVTTGATGIAAFTGCDISGTPPPVRTRSTPPVAAVTSANSSSVSITAGTTATQLVFSTQPAGTVAPGANFTTQPKLTAEDANGNTVTGYASSVTLAIDTFSGSNRNTGVLSCTTNPVTPTNGVATFAGCKISNNGGRSSAGDYTFQATSGAGASKLTSLTSSTVTIT